MKNISTNINYFVKAVLLYFLSHIAGVPVEEVLVPSRAGEGPAVLHLQLVHRDHRLQGEPNIIHV